MLVVKSSVVARFGLDLNVSLVLNVNVIEITVCVLCRQSGCCLLAHAKVKVVLAASWHFPVLLLVRE